jgi:hypothetical protein
MAAREAGSMLTVNKINNFTIYNRKYKEETEMSVSFMRRVWFYKPTCYYIIVFKWLCFRTLNKDLSIGES